MDDLIWTVSALKGGLRVVFSKEFDSCCCLLCKLRLLAHMVGLFRFSHTNCSLLPLLACPAGRSSFPPPCLLCDSPTRFLSLSSSSPPTPTLLSLFLLLIANQYAVTYRKCTHLHRTITGPINKISNHNENWHHNLFRGYCC